MATKKIDYNIKKLEKGPLQRFKNQNLLLKKFGEAGLKLYRAITGRRTTSELRKDLGFDDALFNSIIDYMKETEMIDLVPSSGRDVERAPVEEEQEEKPAKASKIKESKGKAKGKGKKEDEPEPEEEEPKEETKEEAPAEEEPAEEEPEAKEKVDFMEELETPEEEATEEMEIKPETEGETSGEEKTEEEPSEETTEETEKESEEETKEEAPAEEEPAEEESSEEEPGGEEAPAEEETSGEEEKPEEEIEIEKENDEIETEKEESEEDLTSVEKIIKDKYGDVGIRVYNLIDGEKTAEEIMKEVGITESKLIEILDFMDKQGIIKLEYPGEKKQAAVATPKEEVSEGFTPIIETEEEAEGQKDVTIPNPVETPAIISGDIIKSVQVSAKILLKFKDEGKKVFDSIDGKRDVIDIALKVNASIYRVYDVLNYLMDSGMIVLKPMMREYVKKKYGDDGYSIYKKYGREGLMLYELIGKEMSFRQMAGMVTTDKDKAVEMFLFIHEVLGIELPIDREVLMRQLG